MKIFNKDFLKKHAIKVCGIAATVSALTLSACSPGPTDSSTGDYYIYYTDGQGNK